MRPELATSSYDAFLETAEPRLRRALVAAYGPDLGQESLAHAVAYGWEHWSKVGGMPNPAGYLWGVGRNYGRRHRGLRRRGLFPTPPEGRAPWVEPGLPRAMSRLSERERVSVLLIHGWEWTYQEVADLLDVSRSTVQSHVERGMAKLKRSLGVRDEQ